MAVQPARAEHTQWSVRSVPWVPISYLVLGLVALIPRIIDLGGFATVDEINFWIQRSNTFLQQIQAGDFAATTVSTHPGVTTVWLGSIGILLRQALLRLDLLGNDSFATMLALLRLPGVLVHTAGILLGYYLLRRMLPPALALFAALLWLADPFVLAYNRLLHVDGLATTFATLSLLAACWYWHHEKSGWGIALSAVCAGLAMLSKSPAVLIVPMVGAIALAAAIHPPGEHTLPLRRRLTKLVGQLLVWGIVCALTLLALWPALWANPAGAYNQLRFGVQEEGAVPHQGGNFFLGRIDDAPGPAFYAVALLLRTTPWTLLGLCLYLAIVLGRPNRRLFGTERASPRVDRDLIVMVGFIVLFVVGMSIFPKKFNRYILPAFPALDILAAAGLLWSAQLLGALTQRMLKRLPVWWASGGTIGVVGIAALLNLGYWHPYHIAAFNQMLGGAPAGAHAFLVGWGEGLEQVAAWLNTQPDITGVRVNTTRAEPLQPYMLPGAQTGTYEGDLGQDIGYVVVYIRNAQGHLGSPYDQFYSRVPPNYTVRIHGVEYAWIYQVPPAVQQPSPADFGDAIHLRGLEGVSAVQPGQTLSFKLFWEARAALPTNYTLFVHLIGPDGTRATQLDVLYPTSEWQSGRYYTTNLPIAVPAGVAPGQYQVVVGFYDPASGQRLPLVATTTIDPSLDGPDALPLARITVE